MTKNGERSNWREIGAAWSHKDGEGFSLKLDFLPLNGAEIVIRKPKANEAGRCRRPGSGLTPRGRLRAAPSFQHKEISAMTIYEALFQTDGGYAIREFEADTPEQALALARQLGEADPSEPTFQPYDDAMPVNAIEVCGPDGIGFARWRDEEVSLQLAARDLLAALTRAVAALNTAPRFRVASLATDSYAIAAECDKAIATAKGGAL